MTLLDPTPSPVGSPPLSRVERGLLLASSLLLPLALAGLSGRFREVSGSTDAWILAQVTRHRILGDYHAAATLSLNPSTVSNILYPFLMGKLSLLLGLSTPEAIIRLAHGAAALFWGLCVLPLHHLWRSAGGRAVGWLGLLALLFPPLMGTAALVRYDTLGMLLALSSASVAVSAARQASWWRWGAAGILLALTFHAREFLLAPALLSVGLLWLQAVWYPPVSGRSRLRQAVTSLWLLLDGLVVTVLVLPLSVGMMPFNGLKSLWRYGQQGAAPQELELFRTLYLPSLGIPFLLGFLGLLVCLWRASGPTRRESRDALLALLGLILPFFAFPLSAQQSYQYYVLGQVLLLSCLSTGVMLLSRPRLRRVASALLTGLTLLIFGPAWRPVLHSAHPRDLIYHTEAWPVPPEEARAVMTWSLAQAGKRALLVYAPYLENLDALYLIYHQRPVGFLFTERHLEELGRIRLLYAGQPVNLMLVEARQHPPLSVEEQPAAVLETAGLRVRLFSLPALDALEGYVDPGYPCLDYRGVCLQRYWLEGGPSLMWAQHLEPGPEWGGGAFPGHAW